MKTAMNVYMLKTQFAPETPGAPDAIQQRTEDSLRDALKDTPLVNEFSRVSPPYEDTGLMAVICSEDAAQTLREKSAELGIESLVLDTARTHRRQQAMTVRDTNVNYVGALRLMARI